MQKQWKCQQKSSGGENMLDCFTDLHLSAIGSIDLSSAREDQSINSSLKLSREDSGTCGIVRVI